MKRYIHIAKLAVALVAFANGTAGLAASKRTWQALGGRPAVAEAADSNAARVRVQRLPRVPRREPFEAGPIAETATSADA
ncbi:MAG TPA: hypothetical protein VFR73_11290 [Hyphomicrobiaceae bacterium]|jgi:hypothetical protein|nr:hypothetical protein [Hyphomicrobiaceae bacterium]HEX2335407.1 hypothetical protein [Hyphomicrobiaceae bacterium]